MLTLLTYKMVRVKRGGVFVEVKPGESLGREGGRPGVSVPKKSSSNTSSTPTTTKETTTTPAKTTSIQKQQATQSQEAQQREAQNRFLAKYGRSQASPAQRGITTPPIDRERYRIGLSESEKQQPTKKVIKGRFKEVGRGVAKGGIGLAEGGVNFIANMGTAKIEPGKERKTFKFGGKLGEIRDSPGTTGTLIGQAGVYGPLIGGAGAQFAGTAIKQGVSTATRQALYSVAPLKPQSGVYGPLSSQAKADSIKPRVISVKSQTESGLIRRDIIGTAKNNPTVKINSVQFSKSTGSGEISAGITKTTAPQTRIEYGKVIPETKTLFTKTGFYSQAGNVKVQRGIVGAESKFRGTSGRGVTGTFLDVTQNAKNSVLQLSKKVSASRFGSVSKTVGKFNVFGTGQSKRFINFEQGLSGVRVRNLPTRGIEITAPKSSLKPRTSTPGPQDALKTVTTSTATTTIPKPTVTAEQIPKTISLTGVVRNPQPGPQTIQAPAPIQQPQSIAPVQEVTKVTRTIPKVDIAVSSQPKSRSSGRSRTTTLQQPAQIPRTIQVPKTEQTPKTRQTPKSRLIPELIQKQRLVRTEPGPGFRLTNRIPRTTGGFGFRFKLPKAKESSRGLGGFSVQVRRQGVFRTIGTGLTKSQAIGLGVGRVSNTLGASFKIQGPGKVAKIPGFKRSKKDREVFIEPRRRRLSTKGEIKEIIGAKLK